MEDRSPTYASAESSVWIWIILAGILVLAVIIGVFSLAIARANEEAQGPASAQGVKAK